MARNVEIKACLADPEGARAKAAAIADGPPTVIHQDDCFFQCPHGRMKLRTLGPREGQLVFYQRPDAEGPKESFYIVAHTDTPDLMRQAMTHAYGTHGRVVKDRTLFLCGQTRIHLDRVEGLGDFLELEVVLRDDQTTAEGVDIANRILEQLGIKDTDLIAGAYRDLLCSDV